MSLSHELQERGFVYQFSSEKLEDIFDSGVTRTVYLGIEPTANSMHVGHLVPYMMLNHIANAGHNVIVLLGGGTALIGDPSFKEHERDIASEKEITAWCDGLERNIRRITISDSIRFVNNRDWLSKLGAIEFLREVGKHFTVNAMIKKDSVVRRFEQEEGISYTEFSYSLLQAYDFYHLYTQEGCDVQIGGSDQWGNIIAGVEYVRRKTGNEVYALTVQLIVDKTTGKKFGKSEGNAVWLDPEKTSPYQFYQFWLNTADENVINYLKLFTLLPLEEIREVQQEFERDPGKRSAQKRLAYEVTKFVHGAETVELVKEVSDILFGEEPQQSISATGKALLLENAPTTAVNIGDTIVDTLVASGLASSKREARTFIESGAISIGGEKVDDPAAAVEEKHFTAGIALLRRGKRHVTVLTMS